MLYALAKKIIELHPNNKIDWVNTFEVVERSYYFEKEANKANINGFFECIEFNSKLASNQQIQVKIKNRVNKKLSDLKFFKR
jgi:hypothetical protein